LRIEPAKRGVHRSPRREPWVGAAHPHPFPSPAPAGKGCQKAGEGRFPQGFEGVKKSLATGRCG
ncbi:MAG TPA: hypothetical protein VMG63_22980, partial [Terriglobia bacterium]|nr:hypothetical protein [Terriglobia bacterium]